MAKGDSTSYWASNFYIKSKVMAILQNRRILKIDGVALSSIFSFAEPVSRFGQRLEIQKLSLNIETKIETFDS